MMRSLDVAMSIIALFCFLRQCRSVRDGMETRDPAKSSGHVPVAQAASLCFLDDYRLAALAACATS